MLEKMDDFFNNRIDSYEEHQLNMIDSAKEFYPFTAKHLPMDKNVSILDKTTPRLIQFHTLKNAVNPPFLGGFLFSGTVAA